MRRAHEGAAFTGCRARSLRPGAAGPQPEHARSAERHSNFSAAGPPAHGPAGAWACLPLRAFQAVKPPRKRRTDAAGSRSRPCAAPSPPGPQTNRCCSRREWSCPRATWHVGRRPAASRCLPCRARAPWGTGPHRARRAHEKLVQSPVGTARIMGRQPGSRRVFFMPARPRRSRCLCRPASARPPRPWDGEGPHSEPAGLRGRRPVNRSLGLARHAGPARAWRRVRCPRVHTQRPGRPACSDRPGLRDSWPPGSPPESGSGAVAARG